jgi:hypothetical protein
MSERGDAGEWSLYVVASDEERRDEGIVLRAIWEQATTSCVLNRFLCKHSDVAKRRACKRDVCMPKARYPRLRLQGAVLAKSRGEVMFQSGSQWRDRRIACAKALWSGEFAVCHGHETLVYLD